MFIRSPNHQNTLFTHSSSFAHSPLKFPFCKSKINKFIRKYGLITQRVRNAPLRVRRKTEFFVLFLGKEGKSVQTTRHQIHNIEFPLVSYPAYIGYEMHVCAQALKTFMQFPQSSNAFACVNSHKKTVGSSVVSSCIPLPPSSSYDYSH
jgi:hypothetical protein